MSNYNFTQSLDGLNNIESNNINTESLSVNSLNVNNGTITTLSNSNLISCTTTTTPVNPNDIPNKLYIDGLPVHQILNTNNIWLGTNQFNQGIIAYDNSTSTSSTIKQTANNLLINNLVNSGKMIVNLKSSGGTQRDIVTIDFTNMILDTIPLTLKYTSTQYSELDQTAQAYTIYNRSTSGTIRFWCRDGTATDTQLMSLSTSAISLGTSSSTLTIPSNTTINTQLICNNHYTRNLFASLTTTTNSIYNNLIAGGAIVMGSSVGVNTIRGNTTFSETATFSVIPLCSVSATSANHLVNYTTLTSQGYTTLSAVQSNANTFSSTITFSVIPLCSVSASSANHLVNYTTLTSQGYTTLALVQSNSNTFTGSSNTFSNTINANGNLTFGASSININSSGATHNVSLFSSITSGTFSLLTNLASNNVINFFNSASTATLNLNCKTKFRQNKFYDDINYTVGGTLTFPLEEHTQIKSTGNATITLPLINTSTTQLGLTFTFTKTASITAVITLQTQGTNVIIRAGSVTGITSDTTLLGNGFTFVRFCIMEQTTGSGVYSWVELSDTPKTILNDKASLTSANTFSNSINANGQLNLKNNLLIYDLVGLTNYHRIYQSGQDFAISPTGGSSTTISLNCLNSGGSNVQSLLLNSTTATIPVNLSVSGSSTLSNSSFIGTTNFTTSLPTCSVAVSSSSQLVNKTFTDATYQTISGMSAYLTTSVASATYQTISGMSAYLTTSVASATYLSISTASATYQLISDMVNYQPIITGSIVMMSVTGVTPTNHYLCDGSSYSIGGQSQRLFNVIGYTYGGAVGSTFKVPDFRGMFLRGHGTNFTYNTYSSSSIASLQSDTIKSHSHDFTFRVPTNVGSGSSARACEVATSGYATTISTQTNSSDAETRPASYPIVYFIKN